MLRKLLSFRPSHATVVAYLALFVALGGTAYAAATIGSSQVIDNSLQSVDLKDNAGVKSADVVNDSATGGGLGSVDIRNNSLTGGDITESTLAKVPSADKLDGLDSMQLRRNKDYLVVAPPSSAKDFETDGTCDAEESCYLELQCDANDRIVSGGYYGADPGTVFIGSYPDNVGAATGKWFVEYHNDASADTGIYGRAVCVDQAAPFRP